MTTSVTLTNEDERPARTKRTYGGRPQPIPGCPDGPVRRARRDLEWGEIYRVDERTAITAGEIAAEIGPSGPSLEANDALIAAVGRELDAPVVSSDRDLTHPETKRVVDVERY